MVIEINTAVDCEVGMECAFSGRIVTQAIVWERGVTMRCSDHEVSGRFIGNHGGHYRVKGLGMARRLIDLSGKNRKRGDF